jgi:hypothetical protein
MTEAKTRLTVDLKPRHYARLEELEKLVEADSKAELVRTALQLYEFIARRIAKGSRITLTTKDGKEETLLLFPMPLPVPEPTKGVTTEHGP